MKVLLPNGVNREFYITHIKKNIVSVGSVEMFCKLILLNVLDTWIA